MTFDSSVIDHTHVSFEDIFRQPTVYRAGYFPSRTGFDRAVRSRNLQIYIQTSVVAVEQDILSARKNGKRVPRVSSLRDKILTLSQMVRHVVQVNQWS